MKFDPIRLIEYGATFSRRSEPKSRKAKKMKKEFTFKDYLKFQAEMEQFEKLMKEKADEKKKIEKAKEIKKEGVSMSHIAMFLVASFPITAPLYVYFFKMMLENIK